MNKNIVILIIVVSVLILLFLIQSLWQFTYNNTIVNGEENT